MKLTKVQVRRSASMQSISKLNNPEPREHVYAARKHGSEKEHCEECTWQCDNENAPRMLGSHCPINMYFVTKILKSKLNSWKPSEECFPTVLLVFLCVPWRKSPLSPLMHVASQHVVAVALCRENAVCLLSYWWKYFIICLIFFLMVCFHMLWVLMISLCSWWGTRWWLISYDYTAISIKTALTFQSAYH